MPHSNRGLWTFVATSVVLFMVQLDNLVVTTALPTIRDKLVLSSVARDEEGIASGTNNAIRQLGGVLGVAVLAAIFAHYGSTLYADSDRPRL